MEQVQRANVIYDDWKKEPLRMAHCVNAQVSKNRETSPTKRNANSSTQAQVHVMQALTGFALQSGPDGWIILLKSSIVRNVGRRNEARHAVPKPKATALLRLAKTGGSGRE